MPPNNQGIATPFYNQGDNGENPAKDGVATADELDRYTQQSIASLDDGYVAFAGQRDDGFYGDIQAVFDLLQLRNPGKDAQRGFNLHLMALAIPIDELGGDRQMAGVYATTSRRALHHPVRRAAQARSVDGDWVQVARQGNPLFNEGLVAIEDKDLYSRTTPAIDNVLFRKYAENPELAKLLNLIVLEPDIPGIETGRTDIAGIFIPDVIKVDLSTKSARLAGGGPGHPTNPDDPGFSRLSIFGGDVAGQPDPARLRRRRHPRRLAERPPLRRRRRRHRGDGADQRSAHQPAGHPRSRRRQRERATTWRSTRCSRTSRRRRTAAGTSITDVPRGNTLHDREPPCSWRRLSSCACPTTAHAHDPGLSALDVAGCGRTGSWRRCRWPPSDARQPAVRRDSRLCPRRDRRGARRRSARRCRDRSARAQRVGRRRHARVRSRGRHALEHPCDVPKRLASGHRELLTVRAPDGSVVLERMLDAHSGDAGVDLDDGR